MAGQVGLAKRLSPAFARGYVSRAETLIRDLPETFAALRAGVVNEWRALIVAGEARCLTAGDRRAVDVEVGSRLGGLSNRGVHALVRTAVYRRDPQGSLARSRAAVSERRVSLRPAPETMARLSALLPVAEGVAAYQALVAAADAARADGDERGRGQVMADTLVERLTGQATAGDVPVCVNLIMTDQTLLTTATPSAVAADLDPEPVPAAPVPVVSAARVPAPRPGPEIHPADPTAPVRDPDDRPAKDPPVADVPPDPLVAEDRPPPDPPVGDVPPDPLVGGERVLVDALTGEEFIPVRETTVPGTAGPRLRVGGGPDEPAVLDGYGPVPAGLARELITTPSPATRMWLRRLFTAPDTGELVTMETRRRFFAPTQRVFIRLRDQTCRTPYCDAPIRQIDHATAATEGGPTSLTNAQGLCEACNHTKQNPGWTALAGPTGVITTTPTGHPHHSRAPHPPGAILHWHDLGPFQPELYCGPTNPPPPDTAAA